MDVAPIKELKSVVMKPDSSEGIHASPDSDSEVQNSFATELLIFEAEVRTLKNELELNAHLCNSSRKILAFRQCFYGTVKPKSNKYTLRGISSVAVVEKNVPFNCWIEKLVSRLLKANDPSSQVSFTLPDYCDELDEEKETYPFFEFLWTPQLVDGQVVGGVLQTRETPWTDKDRSIATRLADLYLHAQASLRGRKTLTKTSLSLKPFLFGASGLLIALLLAFLPVSVTALAPVEIIPKDPFVIAAPFNGVVKSITSDQGQTVNIGDSLIIFDNVHLLNEKRLADQRAEIALARYQRASQGAIADHRVKREIEVAKAEYELAMAESTYATELLEQADVVAPVSGIVIFSDKSDWEGKPVSAGQAIVSVADPEQVEMSIDLPIKDSIVLSEGARIKVFLDSDPLNPLEATLTDASYQAQPDKRDVLSYRLKARLTDTDNLQPRIGLQGTAQVFSEKASLGYVIFRRPISAFRQRTGW